MHGDHREVGSAFSWQVCVCALAVPLCRSNVAAQPLDRLTGRVVVEQGEPAKDVEVHIEAVFGFAGGDFLGQRTRPRRGRFSSARSSATRRRTARPSAWAPAP
jgi:hypothetical protein